jgi:DNA-directed RNA polymerase beta subunit
MSNNNDKNITQTTDRIAGSSAIIGGPHDSASRAGMGNSARGQAMSPLYPDPPIVSTGTEESFAEFAFNKKIPKGSTVIEVITRYGGLVSKPPEQLVFFYNKHANEFDYISIKEFDSLHKFAGYKNNIKQRPIVGTEYADDTIITQPTTVVGGEYSETFNFLTLMSAHERVGEDAAVISQSAMERTATVTVEKYTFELSKDQLLLNVCGDENNYKAFPNIGERVASNSLLYIVRDLSKNKYGRYLTSKKDMMDYDIINDIGTFTGRHEEGIVIDVIVKKHNKQNPVTNGPNEQLDAYADAYSDFQNQIVNVFKKHMKYNKQVNISQQLLTLINNAIKYLEISHPVKGNRYVSVKKSIPVGVYTLTVVVSYTLYLGFGRKGTDLHGGKYIVAEVVPDEFMPRTKDGRIVELIYDDSSVINRMNPGKKYEQYLFGLSDNIRKMLLVELNGRIIDNLNNDSVKKLFNEFILEPLKIMEVMMYDWYLDTTILEKKQILKETIRDGMHIKIPLEDKPTLLELVDRIRKTKFAPKDETIYIYNRVLGKFEETSQPHTVAKLRHMFLSKLGDTHLTTNIAKTNHAGLPASPTQADKHRDPTNNKPVRTLGEPDLKNILAYSDEKFARERLALATSPEDQKLAVRKILNENKPSGIYDLIDRNKHPYGKNGAVHYANKILTVFGSMITSDDTTSEHDNGIHLSDFNHELFDDKFDK